MAIAVKSGKLVQLVYTVLQAADLIGISDARVYQLIAVAEALPDFLLPEDGVYLKTASTGEMLAAGVNPSVITKPKHWITGDEIERFRHLKRN